MRAVILRRGEDSGWTAECPSLPGCVTQGKTKAEAVRNVKEAIQGWIETMTSHGQPIPEEGYDTAAFQARGKNPGAPGGRESGWEDHGRRRN